MLLSATAIPDTLRYTYLFTSLSESCGVSHRYATHVPHRHPDKMFSQPLNLLANRNQSFTKSNHTNIHPPKFLRRDHVKEVVNFYNFLPSASRSSCIKMYTSVHRQTVNKRVFSQYNQDIQTNPSSSPSQTNSAFPHIPNLPNSSLGSLPAGYIYPSFPPPLSTN